ncbi:Hypothetical protein CINCED_3A016388 [Cinara cedri]|nr:Hypothetical protein CINCED_3A016388 [Cinara cedri]
MAFNFPACTYIVAMITDAFLLFFTVFHVITFDELKNDNKNPIDQCNSLNPLVIPEYILHFLSNLLFFFGSQWLSFAINVPLMAYHILKYQNRPLMSGFGLYDPTTIMHADKLNKYKREGWIKLGFYLFSFFYHLYG